MTSNNQQRLFIVDYKSLIAGVISGGTSNLILHPLDSIKTRIQAAGRGQKASARSHIGLWNTVLFTRDLLKNEGGWRVLYQGLGSSVFGASASWGLYFLIYNSSKNYFLSRGELSSDSDSSSVGATSVKKQGHDLPTSLLLASSLNAGVITTLITHPIWLVKTRLQLQQRMAPPSVTSVATESINGGGASNAVRYKGTVDGLIKIATQEGLTKGLYMGLMPSMFLISHGVIHFVLYDSLKYLYFKRKSSENGEEDQRLNSIESFIMAGASKSVAALCTYPFQVIKTRMQDSRNSANAALSGNQPNFVRYNSMSDAVIKMYRTEGMSSFFRGIIPHVIRVTPAGAITFTIYEFVSNILSSVERKQEV